jgi:hypothetical protein
MRRTYNFGTTDLPRERHTAEPSASSCWEEKTFTSQRS